MTEQEIKAICRLAVEHSRRKFTPAEKEMLKQAVDQSRNMEELFAVAIASLGMGEN